MPLTRKALALSLALLGLLSAVTIAQGQKSSSADSQLVIEDAKLDWYKKSDVSALREGVIDKIELRIGKEVEAGGMIGQLHKEVADLSVAEARIQAESLGALKKAQAQRSLAKAVVARNEALLRRGQDLVSREDQEKAKAEFAAADASVIEAEDTQKLAQAKLKSAERAALEHIIVAPFSGQILEEYKHEGESVRANEPVVKLGNLDKVRVWAYIPIDYAYRVKPGNEIMIQVKLGVTRTGRNPIEQKQFRGVITSVDQSVQAVAEEAVRVYADLDNPEHELKPGLRATMTIFLKPESPVSYTSPAPANQASSTVPRVGSNPLELPPLPR